MNKRILCTALCIFGALSGSLTLRSMASDWVDEGQAAQTRADRSGDMPPVAPDMQSRGAGPQSRGPNFQSPELHVAQGGFLTGSASMVGSGVPATRAMIPNRTMSGYAEQGADTERFLMNARTDNVVPPTSLQGWLQRTHPEFNLNAQTNPDAVIEVKGQWDNSSQILKSMGIRYHEMKAKELRNYPLNNTRVIVINCEGKVPQDAIEPIRQWVIRGGYLISTDWTLQNFLERAFPGMVAWNGEKTKGETVDAMLLPSDPALLAGTNVARGTWKLDEESQEVRILRPDVVHVLAHSFKLAQKDPNRRLSQDPRQWGVLSCEFSYGRGHVLHLVGHFDYNSGLGFLRYILPDAIPGAGIGLRQAIATNFLMEALERPDRRTPAPATP